MPGRVRRRPSHQELGVEWPAPSVVIFSYSEVWYQGSLGPLGRRLEIWVRVQSIWVAPNDTYYCPLVRERV